MPREYHPLLNTSPEPPSPTPSNSHLNYTYSLHAALLAFPLPTPTPPPATTLTRRHSTFSPLQRYNANYDHLTQARQTRLRNRQSLLLPSSPVYALPASYDEIQRLFPHATPTDDSLLVEPDTTTEEAETGVEEVTQRRGVGGRMGIRDGSIAARQKMRKLGRKKDVKEVSVNALRNTTSIVKRGTTGTVKKAIYMVKKSGVKVLRTFHKRKGGETSGAGGDELHKFFYDLQSEGIEEVEEQSLDVDLESSRRGTEVETRSVDTGGRVQGRSESGGEGGMRRQTWTNLRDVLMGAHQQDDDIVGENREGEEFQEEDVGRLETIQEITEVSPCGKRYSTISTPHHQPALTTVINPHHPSIAPSRAASLSSLHTQSSTLSSPAKLYPFSPPHDSLRQLSSSTQDLFNISTAYYTTRTTSDPIKPVSQPHHPTTLDGEITRDDDTESVYSEILAPGQVERSVSVLGQHETDLVDGSVGGRKFSTSTTWGVRPLTFESRTVSSRHVSSSTTNWVPTAPLPASHDVPTTFPTHTTPANDTVIRHVSSLETSMPAIESWKWAPPAAEQKKENTLEERGKSVLERVRELDLVIDEAMGLHEGGKKVGGRKGGMFGLWRS